MSDQNPPKREPAGIVAPTSLAAESVRAGGDFTANRNMHTDSGPDDAASTKPHQQPTDIAASSAEQAPSYINTVTGQGQQQQKPRGGTEDEDMIGRPAKFEVSADEVARQRQQAEGGAAGGGAPGLGEEARWRRAEEGKRGIEVVKL